MTSTTVFIREEHEDDAAPFARVEHSGSITLQTLMDGYDVSCVLECDGQGKVLPRAIVMDEPSEPLHRGAYYITRKKHRNGSPVVAQGTGDDATSQRAVHFNTRVAVKEYSLPSGVYESSGRPSIDLLAAAQEAKSSADHPMASSQPDCLNDQQCLDSNGPNSSGQEICFKSFAITDALSGKPVIVTLDYFLDVYKRSTGRLDEAEHQHSEVVKTITDTERFIASCTSS